MDINDLRKKIDDIDDQLVEIFEERLGLVEQIGQYKQKHHLSIFDEQREKVVVEKALAAAKKDALKPYVEDYIREVMRISTAYQKNKNNQFLFLIGMPGAGKTVVGRALAQELEVEFYDLDLMIQERAGRSIQNIIIYDGEPAFRELEYEVIKDIIKLAPGVIATGGGTVISEKTTTLMQKSGIVIYVHRDVTQILNDLDLEIRPLLKESIEYIFQLYEERCPLYEKVSHMQVQNASSIKDAVREIIDKLPKNFIRAEKHD